MRITRPLAAALIACSLTMAGPATARRTEPQAAEMVIYDIRAGDTLYSLTQDYFTGPAAMARVARVNHIRNHNLILAGSRLKIPRHLLREEKTSARIEAFSGDVQVQAHGRPMKVEPGLVLQEQTLITTGRNAFVSLRLADQSTVALPSQSTIRISRMRKILLTGAVEREFLLETGRARMEVTPMRVPESNFHIITPVSHAAVRGTVFRSRYDSTSGGASTSVEDGTVEVTEAAAASQIMVGAGLGVAMADGKSTGAVPLLAAPTLVDPAQVQTEEELRFILNPVAEAQSYRLEFARDAGMLDVLAEATAATPEITLPSQPAGDYFVRLTAIDANGIEGIGKTYGVVRRRNSVSGAMAPGGSGGERRFLFRWNVVADGTPSLRFRLTRADGGTPVVDEPALTGDNLTVTNLEPGEYIWQIQSVLVDRGRAIESWMPAQRFEVVATR